MHKTPRDKGGPNAPGTCGVCGGTSIIYVESMACLNPALEEVQIPFYMCNGCACVFHNELNFLPGDYYNLSYFNNPVRKDSLSKSLDFIMRYTDNINKPTVVDIGCSNGNFMLLLKDRGFKIVGVEASEKAQKEASIRGLKVYGSPQNFIKNHFDLLIFSHVIEHYNKPTDYIKEYIPFLKDDGAIYIEVPSIELLARGCESTYNNLYPSHINHFSEYSLFLLARQLACSVIAMEHHNYLDYPSLMCLFRKHDPNQYQLSRIRNHLSHGKELNDKIAKQIAQRSKKWEHLVIWGCSDEAYQILKRLPLPVIKKTILIDSSQTKIGKNLKSLSINSPEHIKSLNNILYFIAPTSPGIANDIKRSIEEYSHGKNYLIECNSRTKSNLT